MSLEYLCTARQQQPGSQPNPRRSLETVIEANTCKYCWWLMCMTGQLRKPNGLEGNLVRNGPSCCGDCRRSVSSTPSVCHHAHPDLSNGGGQPVVSAERLILAGQQVPAADCHLQVGIG